MFQKTSTLRPALVGCLLIALALTAACAAPTVDQVAVQQRLTALEQEASNLQQQLADKEQEIVGLRQENAAAEEAPSQAIWETVPDAPPRATRTPLPPGATPPPPPELPASFKDPLPLFFYVDTVTAGAGESKYNVDASLSCVRSGVFKHGMHIVWRMEVIDTATGIRLTDADMDSVLLNLPHGEQLNFRFSRHGSTDDAPWFWTSAWDVPLDYPLGTVDYTIEALTKDGKTGTFKELSPSLLTIIDGEGS